MSKRGPLRCSHKDCDRYSVKTYGWFKLRRFWHRSHNLLKDAGVEVGRVRWREGRCHHHGGSA